MMWEEAELVVERQNANLATVGAIIQAATATTGMAAGKESAKHFKDLIDRLNGE